jgi:hypothetical protein
MTKKEIIKIVIELDQKYNDLVWLARSSPDNYHIKGVKENIERVTKAYPSETDALINARNTDWEHGFNSGMLAGMRYILDMVEMDKETADEFFPNLDT